MLAEKNAPKVENQLKRSVFLLIVPFRENGVLMESLYGHVLFERNISKAGQLLLKELFFDNKITRTLEILGSGVSGHACFLSNDFGGVWIDWEGLLEGSIEGDKFLFFVVLFVVDKLLSEAFLFFWIKVELH